MVEHALFHLKRADCQISFDKLRNELLAAQSSVVVDVTTNQKDIVPSKTTQLQREIYKAFGMKRTAAPYVCE